MAARSGVGVGVITTITILGILTLTLFITTVVYYGNANRFEGELDNLARQNREIISDEERQDAALQAFQQIASRDRRTLVGYLSENLRNTMQDISGTPRDDHARFRDRLNAAQFSGIARAKGWQPTSPADQPPAVGRLVEGSNMMALLSDADRHITRLTNELAAADASRRTAEQDLANEVARVGTIERTHRQTVDRLIAQVGQMEAQVEQFRLQTNDSRSEMDSRVSRLRSEADDRQDELARRLANLEAENARLINQVEVLRGQRSAETLSVQDEDALVDGRVIAVDARSGEVTINIGRANRAVLGMSFGVFSSAADIRPDADGNIQRGKATIEIIRIDETTSVARITRETRGNPIIRNDVIANAVFDPNKVYTLMLVGNFDLNRDGLATAQEREQWRSIIESWGGRVVDELTGDIDFLVMGRRPVPRAEPSPNAPIQVVQEYLDELALAERYDQLFERARATSIPVLNENRLRTLTGRD